ncbi:MAG: VanZ family protein [Acidobacteria bacterium]|nr:VanZ family protein [Acidobacteriota bacterium]
MRGSPARYRAATAGLLAAIFLGSAIPYLTTYRGPVVQFLSNAGHAPLFALLALLWLRSLSAGPGGPRYGLALAVSMLCAVLDEWHQSFVPGRTASLSDLMVDLAGIGAMLAAVRWRTRTRAPRRASSLRARSDIR